MSFGTSQPFIAAFTVVRKDDKVAFVLRQKTDYMDGHYGLPCGKIEINEPASAAAIREAREEIGITIKPEHLRPVLTMHRNEPGNEYREWVDFYFETSAWTGEAYNAEPHMHKELVWLGTDELPNNVVPSVRAAIEAIERAEKYLEFGFN